MLEAVKKIGLFAAGVASQRYMAALQDQQEVMADLADIITQVFALESALLRARKLAAAGKSTAALATIHDQPAGRGEHGAGRADSAARTGCLQRGRYVADTTGDPAAVGALYAG